MASLRALAAITLSAAHGVRADPSKSTVAEQLSNPIASLTSLQLQSDQERAGGPSDHGFRWTLTVDALLPFSINDRWGLISRSTVPIVHQAGLADAARQTGVGSAQQSVFVTPKHTRVRGLQWGVGPIVQFPATDARLGERAFGLGPTAAIIHVVPPVTYGALVEHVWSVGASAETYVEPQIACALGGAGTTVRVHSEAVYGWTARQWTVPVIGELAQVVPLAGHDVELSLAPIGYVERAVTDPRWGVRVTITMVP